MYNYLETKMTWRIIARYPNYEIDTVGSVKNIHTGKYMKDCKSASGYARVYLHVNGVPKAFYIQDLMEETFTLNEIMGIDEEEDEEDEHHYNIFGEENLDPEFDDDSDDE